MLLYTTTAMTNPQSQQTSFDKTGSKSDMGLSADQAPFEVDDKLRFRSHVKLFLPNLTYLGISHALNGALVRPGNNNKGCNMMLQ